MTSLGHLGPPKGSNPRLRCQRWVVVGRRLRSVMQDLDVSGLSASAACALAAVGVWEA